MANSIGEGIERCNEELKSLSEVIWRNPELSYEEHTAHRVLTDFLEKEGFEVDRGYLNVATAFRARFGSGKPNVCVVCEYDALPEIGHACGHNLIAEAGVAAGLGVKAFLKASGKKGTVTVMGTPAEEGGGGKIDLISGGAFEDVDVAMMAHPAPFECVVSYTTALSFIRVDYVGKAAHAAAYPWEGINALDAAVMAYNNVSVLRQQMKPTWRVHGIITNGGAKPNIIPEKAAMEFYIRAPQADELLALKSKVISCLEAAAKATGCRVEVVDKGTYLDIISNQVLAKIYSKHLEASGVSQFAYEHRAAWSTDMGNVSYAVPSIHPSYLVGSGNEVNHTRDFTAVANTAEAHSKTLVIGKAMALTCVDVLNGGEELMQEIKSEFAATVPVLGK